MAKFLAALCEGDGTLTVNTHRDFDPALAELEQFLALEERHIKALIASDPTPYQVGVSKGKPVMILQVHEGRRGASASIVRVPDVAAYKLVFNGATLTSFTRRKGHPQGGENNWIEIVKEGQR